MAETMKLEIVTPDATIYSADVEAVTIPGSCGEMQVYPMHVPLVTQLAHGQLVIRKDGQDEYLAVGDGFVEITCSSVSVLTDLAIHGKDADAVASEEARRAAMARFKKTISNEEAATVSAAVAHAIGQFKHKSSPKNR